MTDLIAVSTGPARTYPPPQAVRDEALRGVRWVKAYGTDVPAEYQEAAVMLASSQPLEIDQIRRLSTLAGLSLTEKNVPGDSGYPNVSRILASLAGGEAMTSWGGGVVASLGTQAERDARRALWEIDYDPSDDYVAVCASTNPDVVTDLARQRAGRWQRWNPPAKVWEDVDVQSLTDHPAVAPDRRMIAAVASALGQGDRLLMSFGAPAGFLPDGVIASVLPDDVESETVFAIVDELDHAAVHGLLKVSPGPRAAIWAAGEWSEYDDIYERMDRPPVVALGEAEADSFVARFTAAELAGVSRETPGDLPAMDEAPPGGPADMVTVLDRTFGEIIAAIGSYHDDDEEDSETRRTRRRKDRALVSAVESVRDWAVLHARRNALAVAADPEAELSSALATVPSAVVAAGATSAERLRRYWTQGAGAVRIQWGVEGDWRRCVRQMRKYLGDRAVGYCQLRHKEATGMFTGDRRHRKPVVAAAGETNGGGMIALIPTVEDAKRLAVDADGAEPPDELHVTLAFLGDAETWSDEQRAGLVRRIRSLVGDVISPDLNSPGAVAARAFGVNLWNPGSTEIPPCWVLAIGDSQDLPWVHGLAWEAIYNSGGEIPEIPPQHEPWVPHLTLAFGQDTISLDDAVRRVGPVTFDRIRVVFAGDITDIPLSFS